MKRIGIAFLLILLLTGCTGLEAPSRASGLALAQANSPTPRPPVTTPRPPKPTTTAVVFQLQDTSTPQPTLPPLSIPIQDFASAGPVNFPVGVNPLTGLAVADPSLLERRPMAIKVTNFDRNVRPQWGLSLADHVYEYYLEWGLTRFVGIFYGNDASRVGPIRSARFFDEHLIRMYKAIFVFDGADKRVMDHYMSTDLVNYLVIERPDNCPPICRIGPKGYWNTVYANTQQLTEYIRARGTNDDRQDLSGLLFSQEAPVGGQEAQKALVHFSNDSYNQWEYDPNSGRYLRFQETQSAAEGEALAPLEDSLSGEQLAADNLVILLVPHHFFIKTNTTEIFEMNMLGQGTAYVFREGQLLRVNWRRDAVDHVVKLAYPNGSLYALKPGNTWYEVLSDETLVEPEGAGQWRFTMVLPEAPTPTP